ncbi:IQ domain-containing protein IQM6 isoform X1 [Syzygium oleosum]|uniref:IQ domain-containing protein IQM6 isoform X1 n=1 Tax=Syzygium oleosum TaxID=219896 RepID=UPI0024BA9D30|nr:IQ domain-containing protein IQM6 isoform X1 [Syzygium oleosum]
MVKSYASRNIASPIYSGKEIETALCFSSPSLDREKKAFLGSTSLRLRYKEEHSRESDGSHGKHSRLLSSDPANSRSKAAATKLQTVYRSFRTRRQLADCAVLVEQRWWKLLDFAELKRSSISFFDIEKPETAVSRWSRARTRAAKVGKGSAKDEKARKLALQHWLEAIDPRHRYGHNLQFYYVMWLRCSSKQPFFYWLDIGEGREVNMDRCPRARLHQQCIKYLGPTERTAFEVIIESGKFSYKQSGEILDTRGGPRDTKWIFVLSTSKDLYVGKKSKGTFQHSSFLAGGATLSAGRLEVDDGILKAVWPHSGHYLPTEENFEALISYLKEKNVDLTNVKVRKMSMTGSYLKKCPTEDEEADLARKGNCLTSNPSEVDLVQLLEELHGVKSADKEANLQVRCGDAISDSDPQTTTWSRRIGSSITKLEIPQKLNGFHAFGEEALTQGLSRWTQFIGSPSEDGYETPEESFLAEEDFITHKLNMFDEEEADAECPVPREKILQRIDSHKGTRSYQLGQQLSCKWTTGAGPRIGCMRDYPSELQSHVLELANLSPRGSSTHVSPFSSSRFSPKVVTPTSLCREATASRSRFVPERVMMSHTATP